MCVCSLLSWLAVYPVIFVVVIHCSSRRPSLLTQLYRLEFENVISGRKKIASETKGCGRATTEDIDKLGTKEGDEGESARKCGGGPSGTLRALALGGDP